MTSTRLCVTNRNRVSNQIDVSAAEQEPNDMDSIGYIAVDTVADKVPREIERKWARGRRLE
jgi:hypothetical protein